MVISQILGGLGNQMFQYAAGRALSLAVEQPFLLDLQGFFSTGESSKLRGRQKYVGLAFVRTCSQSVQAYKVAFIAWHASGDRTALQLLVWAQGWWNKALFDGVLAVRNVFQRLC
jgi:hypothetical protein